MPQITVDFVAKLGSFITDIDRARKSLLSSTKQMREELKRIGTALGAAGVSGAVGLATLSKQAIDTADNLAKMSQKVGVSVESLSTLGYAAQQAGGSVEGLQSAMVKLAKNAGDAAIGTGEAIKGFDALGISVTDAEGKLKNNDVLLLEIAQKLATFEDSAQKTALAVNLFGRSGAELIPLLNEGAEGIAELQQRARDLGIEFSSNTAKQAEEFNDLVSDMGNLAKGLGNDIATALLPSLVGLADHFVNAGIEGRKTGDIAGTIKESFDFLAITFIKGLEAVRNIGAGFAYLVDVIGQVVEAVKSSSEPLSQYFSALQSAFSGDLIGAATQFEEALGSAQAVGEAFRNSIGRATDNLGQSFTANAKAAQAAIDAMSKSADRGADALEETGKQGKRAAPALVDSAKAAREAEKAAKLMAKAQEDAVKATVDLTVEQDRMEKVWKETDKRFAQQAADIQFEIDLLRMNAKERNAAIIALQAETMARDENGKVVKKQAKEYQRLLTEWSKQEKAAAEVENILSRFQDITFSDIASDISKITDELRMVSDAASDAFDPDRTKALQNALGGLRQSALEYATGALSQGISSLQSMADEGSTAYKRLETAQLALNVVTAIGAVLNQGKGDPYTAFARMAAMAAAVAALVGNIAFGGGSGGASTSQSRQETQGTGTILGDATAKSESIANAVEITADATSELVGINRGMLNALQRMQAGISGAAASVARIDFGDVSLSGAFGESFFGSILGGFGTSIAGRLLGGIFGGGQELIDQGIRIGGGSFGSVSSNPNASSFQTIETDGGLFRSDRVSDEVERLSASAITQIQLILTSIGDAVREGAIALGLDAQEINAAIEAFRIEEIRISTMDLTGEEAQRELEASFSAIFDELAGAIVPFIDQFQMVGEGLGETLVRVATSVQVTQEAIRQLGLTFDDSLTPERLAQVSVALVEASGGIEDFISGMQSFVANFAPESHQFAVAQDELTRALEQAGLTLPATRDGMWQLMQSLDATTESGAEQIATLLRLAGVADSYYNLVEQGDEDRARLAREYADAQEEAAEAERDRLEAIKDIIQSYNEQTQSELIALGDSTMSPLQQQLAQIQRETLEQLRRAIELGATEADRATIALLGQARATVAVQMAAMDFAAQLEQWTFDEALLGMSEADAELARTNRTWQERYEQAVEIFGDGSEQAIAVLDLWGAATGRVTEAAEAAAEAARQLARELTAISAGQASFDLRGARRSIADILNEATIGVRGDGLTEQQRAIEQVNQRFADMLRQLNETGQSGLASAIALGQGQQYLAELQEARDYLEELRIEALGNLELEWAEEIAAAREELYERELEWIRRLQGIQDSLLLDPNLSTLTAAEMLAEAQSQYEAALAGVQSGDLASRDIYEDALRAYLEQARAFYGSSTPYLDIFDQVIENNQGLIDQGITDLGANVAADALAAPVETVNEIRGLREDNEEQAMATVGELNEIRQGQLRVVDAVDALTNEIRQWRREQPRVTA